ncbi:hypothetical protein WN944_006892 [Citrus x changshan-huyou]|uniref:Uncharacterized protein n=3 Tax=Citrus TaxID=2706 RepID=V4V227_CITCL|nr:hypothetical protein CICLE_v10001225mg [Citrus x clementina]
MFSVYNMEECLQVKLKKLSPLPSNCCIYRVPERLRQINEKVYTPQVVSIGPLHHGKANLQFMEEHKQRYLHCFLQRTNISFDEFVQIIKFREAELRGSYAEKVELSSDKFVEMILLDAAFIIELLLRYHFRQLQKKDDHIFHKPYLIEDIWYDMWLLENQLPFFILEDLFALAAIEIPDQHENPIIITVTYEFFKGLEAVQGNRQKFPPYTEVRVEHFLDFLRICHLPSSRNQEKQEGQQYHKGKTAPSVTDLHQAGVHFSLSKSNDLFAIEFKNRTLHIPKLKLQLETESLFRNLIAFEQRHYSENYINDYVFLIHHLVNTAKDVELLVQNGIIENWLPDKETASMLLNNLSRGTTLLSDSFYFSGLCKGLNDHCKRTCYKWRANLKQNYFNTPWAGISVCGAVFLLILTVIQSVCSVIQLLSQPKNIS